MDLRKDLLEKSYLNHLRLLVNFLEWNPSQLQDFLVKHNLVSQSIILFNEKLDSKDFIFLLSPNGKSLLNDLFNKDDRKKLKKLYFIIFQYRLISGYPLKKIEKKFFKQN